MKNINVIFFAALMAVVTCESLLGADVEMLSLDLMKVMRGECVATDDVLTINTATGKKATGSHAGVMAYFKAPFNEGKISFEWKLAKQGSWCFLIDNKPNGKATHALKVITNGNKKISKKPGHLVLTYDGSTRKKKKAKKYNFGEVIKTEAWNTFEMSIEGNRCLIKVNDQDFEVVSDKFTDPFFRFGLGNDMSMQVRSMKVDLT